MSIRQFLLTMFFATVLCWISWALILFNIDPFHSNFAGFLFFYLSLFLSLLGTGSIIFSVFSLWRQTETTPLFRLISKSFWQATILAAILVLLLYLQAMDVLRVWNVAVFSFVLLLFFIYRYTTRDINNNSI